MEKNDINHIKVYWQKIVGEVCLNESAIYVSITFTKNKCIL